jgi:hypothetical protein
MLALQGVDVTQTIACPLGLDMSGSSLVPTGSLMVGPVHQISYLLVPRSYLMLGVTVTGRLSVGRSLSASWSHGIHMIWRGFSLQCGHHKRGCSEHRKGSGAMSLVKESNSLLCRVLADAQDCPLHWEQFRPDSWLRKCCSKCECKSASLH